ncbi:MAG: dihydrofolate reductase [Thermodesulfobacteriota bacterium]|nr:dihydrofolate reductase [Thermodesulfobacteriota bacterium]
MELILIAAMAKNRVIGKNNKIPWHIPEEMRHFKESTMGHAVIMGRKTFESLGTPLPGRLNVVLSRDSNIHCPGFLPAGSLQKGLDCCQGQEKIFIIGGQDLFRESMQLADTILLSILDRDYEGDTLFPHIPTEQFQLISEKRMGDSQPFTLFTYQRKTST